MDERPAYLALVRHGAYHQRPGAPSARQPYPLTDAGQAQATQCGADLADLIAAHGLTLDPVIHSSCQLRAWQTAAGIAEALRARDHAVREIRETPSLAERGLGSAANLTVAEIEAVLAADPRHAPPPTGWKADSHYRLPLEGAESLMQAGARVARYLQHRVGRDGRPGQVTVCVGHGAAFRHAAHHLGLLAFDDIARLSMFHARPLLFCYSPRGKWRHFAGSWKVRPPKDDPKD
ncbi:histidine phosphatase family protein [Rhodovulum adriaticum]|uniref:phosphoglycerate mutase (2,3-diphosphoglycerate-dependent) n=1 Tax=Rhodovulum adriaticum TaxID=35804 RepID=A0A4R2NLK7_RHOAD|nr:phosphoglycerate mutase family protein [Rhodovulum adriaticum]MBK1635776.1 phosphoglycerate mutase [Rhodovulum adriaticum]TCP22513.1 2,3-bisphosphoglycerate-dependent phosphoglycerate mutase [Rhodovulum adriaticum]